MKYPKRRKFTADEFTALADIDGVTITAWQTATKGELICDATDRGFMVEGPGGIDVGGTLDDVVNLFASS
jgi:hypothetical protein